MWWIHTTRDASQHAFADEAHRLLQGLPRAHERIFYTSPGNGPPPPVPVLHGRPTLAALAGLGLPSDATAYLCGPGPFMDDLRTILGELGLPLGRVHTEFFSALAAINPGVTDLTRPAPHQPAGAAGSGFAITFARSALTVRWADRHGSLLELADACDVPTRYSCRTGVCHTCVTPLLAGEVNYVLEPLEAPADGTVLLCCARPESEIVLDM